MQHWSEIMDPNIRKRRHNETIDSKEEFYSYFQKLTNDEKEEECRRLFEMCPKTLLPKIEGMAALMQKQDYISELPPEVSKKILRYLGGMDLVSAQLVSKRWRNAVVDLPSYRVICNHLDVDKSEYTTKEQALAICDHIVETRQCQLHQWFSHVVYQPGYQIKDIDSLQLVKFNNVDYIITVGNDRNGTYIVDIAIIENAYVVSSLCRFQPDGSVRQVKVLSLESIFCANGEGAIERWNVQAQLISTYRYQHENDFRAVDGNEERDLLFGCDYDGNLISWRMSTGELLCRLDVHAHESMMSIQLNASGNLSKPIIGALNLNEEKLLIFSCTTDGQLDRLYELDGVFRGSIEYIRPTLDSFRFLHAEKENQGNPSLEIWNWFIKDYCFQTGEIKSRAIDFHREISDVIQTKDGFQFINFPEHFRSTFRGTVLLNDYSWDTGDIRCQEIDFDDDCDCDCAGVGQVRGSKYILFNLWYADFNQYRLMLFEKQGKIWKMIKESLSSGSRRMGAHEYISGGDWLNGLRPQNTNGLAYAYCDYDDSDNNSIYCFIWE